jgi:hypothetical protein
LYLKSAFAANWPSSQDNLVGGGGEALHRRQTGVPANWRASDARSSAKRLILCCCETISDTDRDATNTNRHLGGRAQQCSRQPSL